MWCYCAEGEGLRRFKKGDRVLFTTFQGVVYVMTVEEAFIFPVQVSSVTYGWQRNGGMAPYILAEEKDLVELPDELTFKDGAQVACGFELYMRAIEKIGVCGNDAVLNWSWTCWNGCSDAGKGNGANKLIGVEINDYRINLAKQLGLADYIFKPGEDTLKQILEVTGGKGVERSIDASASDAGRQLAIRVTRQWGKIAFVGEGGSCTFQPSPDIIHGQKAIYGSWVTSLWKMEELVERLVRWGIHPEELITHEFSLDEASDAYKLMADGNCGKVAITFQDE